MATKVKLVVMGVLMAAVLALSGCEYNGDTSTWKPVEPVSAKGGILCLVVPDAAACK